MHEERDEQLKVREREYEQYKKEKCYTTNSDNTVEFEFHGFNKDLYHCFSSFSKYSFIIDSLEWPTVNHYFQAMKFEDENYKTLIRNAADPYDASWLGKDRTKKIKNNWNEIRYSYMYKATKAKFEQNIEIRKILLDTGDRNIICHNPEGIL